MTRSRIGWLAGFLVGLLGVFVVANLGVVAAERRLPPMDDYYDVRAHDVAHDMDRLQAAGVHSDAVLVGTSQMARGGVPRAIEAQTGFKYIHNVALPGASTEVVKRWMLDEVVPRIHPRRVIWGVSSIDFNGGRPNPVIAKYDGARATRPGVLGTADRTLASMVPLARRRVELRAPIQLAEDLRAGKPPALQRDKRPIDKLLGPMRTGTGKKLQRAYTYLRRQQLADFKATPPYVNAFTSTLRDLKAQGIETVVVIMPVPTLFRAAHPKGAAQYEAWKAMAIKAARDSGAKVLDLNHTEPDVDFPDYVHLTRPAALSWSTLLGQDLHAKLGWGTSGSTSSGSTNG